jgi:hypothetical protein
MGFEPTQTGMHHIASQPMMDRYGDFLNRYTLTWCRNAKLNTAGYLVTLMGLEPTLNSLKGCALDSSLLNAMNTT